MIYRLPLRWPNSLPSEDHLVGTTDSARILVRASWQRQGNGRIRQAPALVLVHGLEGSDSSPYMVSTGALAFRYGWHVVRMNMRGCGASLSLCPQLYNAGLADDLLAVLRWTEARGLRSVVAGFSLGAGLSLFTLATRAHEIPRGVAGLAAVSPPLDMSRSADELEKPKNVLYHTRFLVSLKRSYRQRQRLDPSRYEEGLENGIDSLRAFDDVVTARYGGYRDAEHYYRSVSAGARLSRIEHRTLILMARDDPFIPPPESLALSVANRVHVQITEGGGHVGFVGAAQAPYRFWAGDRILAFAAYALRKRSGS